MTIACTKDCGACCDPVLLPYGRIAAMSDPAIPKADRDWARDHLSVVSAKEGYAKHPYLKGRAMVDQFGEFMLPVFYRCDLFDTETRRCTDYDNRPGTCRNYPLYGGTEVAANAALPPGCSYVELKIKPAVLPCLERTEYL